MGSWTVQHSSFLSIPPGFAAYLPDILMNWQNSLNIVARPRKRLDWGCCYTLTLWAIELYYILSWVFPRVLPHTCLTSCCSSSSSSSSELSPLKLSNVLAMRIVELEWIKEGSIGGANKVSNQKFSVDRVMLIVRTQQRKHCKKAGDHRWNLNERVECWWWNGKPWWRWRERSGLGRHTEMGGGTGVEKEREKDREIFVKRWSTTLVSFSPSHPCIDLLLGVTGRVSLVSLVSLCCEPPVVESRPSTCHFADGWSIVGLKVSPQTGWERPPPATSSLSRWEAFRCDGCCRNLVGEDVLQGCCGRTRKKCRTFEIFDISPTINLGAIFGEVTSW